MSAPMAIAAMPPRPYKDYPHLRDLRDDELLSRFFQRSEEGAFAVLVARYGSLVYGVCHRVLGNATDAEDAFQATFLVLVKKGASLRQPDRLANWLYGVAYRTANKVKCQAALRSRLEREAHEMPVKSAASDMTCEQLLTVLDEEINHLPAKYSLPLVLCYLEGKTNAEAAAQLGWPEGSMSRRLSRAREILKARLSRRGLAMTAVLLAATFARPAAACAPAHLVASTVEAGSLVAQGAKLTDVVSPVTARIVEEIILGLSQTYKFVLAAVLAAASLLIATTVVVTQVSLPGFGTDNVTRNDPSSIMIPANAGGPEGPSFVSISIEAPARYTARLKGKGRTAETRSTPGEAKTHPTRP